MGVPVRDYAALAEALARLQLEAEVPGELWAAVAEALVWAYRLSAYDHRTGTAGALPADRAPLHATLVVFGARALAGLSRQR